MSNIDKQWLQQKIAEMEATRDEIPFGLDEDDSNTLAALRIALASLEAEIHSYTFEDDPRPLYTAPPAPAFEIKDLEHFISFWKKVQAGQMNPGKNDIDHTVWFLEGLSDLTAPPAPVSVPDEATPENIEILASTFAPRGVTYQWDRDECNAAADSWNACRAAILNGEKS